MIIDRLRPRWVWAMRDLLRFPGESAMLVLVLAVLALVMGLPLLLTESVSRTVTDILEESAPSVVVQKMGVGGWEPMPVGAVEQAMGVTGVTSARARIWGVVRTGDRTVTAVAVDSASADRFRELTHEGLPEAGTVLVGPGVGAGEIGSRIQLDGVESISVTVAGRFKRSLDMAVHDLVIMHPRDTRKLLGLADGMATDLAVNVYHPSEEPAILPDLAAAFPWPVRLTTRTDITGIYQTAYTRRGGLVMMMSVPAVLALALLVFISARRTLGRTNEIGLMKALGWTPADIITMHVVRAVFLGVPGVIAGLSLAYWLVFSPGVSWPGALFLGWTTSAPELDLTPAGAGTVLLELAALILIPFVAAAGWAAMRTALASPASLLEERSQ